MINQRKRYQQMELKVLQYILLVVAFLYPAWGYFLTSFDKNIYEDIPGRIFFGALCLLILFASHKWAFINRHIINIFEVIVIAISIHYFYIYFESGRDELHYLGAFVFMGVASACLFTKRGLLIYSVLSLFLCSYPLIWGHANFHDVFLFCSQITLLSLPHATLGYRIQLMNTLNEQTALLAKFEIFWEKAGDAMLLIDSDSLIVEMNAAAIKAYGLTKKNLKGKSFKELFVAGEEIRVAHESDRYIKYESTHCRQEGTTFAVELAASLVYLDGRPYNLVNAKDITTRRLAEEELRMEQEKRGYAMKLNSLSEFANGIAHEVNNPLAIILAGTEQLQESISNNTMDAAQSARKLQSIHGASLRIQALINTLDVIHSRSFSSTDQAHSLKILLSQLDARFTKRLMDSQVRLILPTIPENWTVKIEPGDFLEILSALIANSFDSILSSGVGGVIIVSIKEHEGMYVLELTDSGAGVSTEIASKIFDPFFSTKDVARGRGLGLSVARSLAELQGGTLVLEGCERTTTFILTLPRLANIVGKSSRAS